MCRPVGREACGQSTSTICERKKRHEVILRRTSLCQVVRIGKGDRNRSNVVQICALATSAEAARRHHVSLTHESDTATQSQESEHVVEIWVDQQYAP